MNICRIPIKRKSLKFLICKLNFDSIPSLDGTYVFKNYKY